MNRRNGSRVRTRLGVENLESRQLMAVDFSILVDSNDVPTSYPRYAGWTSAVGSDVVFVGEAGSAELWKIRDEQTGSAQQISDFGAVYGGIVPAKAPLSIGNRTIFYAGDLPHGAEMWSTDGTAAGTFMLRDIFNGPGASMPSPAVRVGNTAYFVATDTDGRGLWQTDGTVAGTKRILSSYDSNNLNLEEGLGEFQGQIYFVVRDHRNLERHLATVDPVSGQVQKLVSLPAGQSTDIVGLNDRLLISNGAQFTKPDELLSYDPQSGSVDSIVSTGVVISRPEVFSGRAFFSVSNQLWATDGSIGGTQLLISDGVHEYRPRPLGLVIAAIDHRVLTVVNGNYTVKDMLTGELADTGIKYPGHPYYTSIVAAGNKFVFMGVASDGSFNLYTMDVDSVSPEIIKTIDYPQALNAQLDGSGGGLTYPTVTNGRVFLPLRVDSATLLHEYIPNSGELVAVAPVHGTLGSDVTLLEHTDSATWFTTKSGPNQGVRLWQTDGSPTGTREITFPAEAGTPWLVQMPQVIDGRLVLELTSAETMSEHVRWSVDPASGRPERLGTLPGLSVSKIFETKGERFQFRSLDGSQLELRRIGNDLSIGEVITSIPKRVTANSRIELTHFGDRVLFVLDSQFWQSDGTADGTFQITTGTNSDSAFQQPLVIGDKAWLITRSREFYLAPDAGNQAELVGKLPDGLSPWTQRFQESKFYALGDRLVFIGTLAQGDVASWVTNSNLWITDGTAAGTQLVWDFARGREDVSPRILGTTNGKAIVASGNARSGFDLWASDGTTAHTSIILHSDVGDVPYEVSQTFDLLPDGRALVQSFYPQVGREIVITDGSRGGTALFADIAPGSMSSFARFLVAGEQIIAAAQTLEYGRWETFAADYRDYVRDIPTELTFYADEDTPGAFLGEVVANGVTPGGETVFRLRGDLDADMFDLDAATGQLRLKSTASLDFETKAEVHLTAEVDYRDSSSGEMATRAIPLTVRAINQVEPPQLDPQTFFVEENVAAGVYLGTIVAKRDSASNLQFMRTGGWPVRIDPGSGRMYVLDPTIFNYESIRDLIVAVEAYDPITGFRDQIQLTIKVQDVDEAPLLAVRPEPIDVFSDNTTEIVVPASTFTDPELQPLTYTLALASGEALPSWITFDATSRKLQLSPTADHVGAHRLRLTVTDAGGNSASVNIEVTVFQDQFRWHNPVSPNDVNRDGAVSPLDVLLVINQLNTISNNRLSDDNAGLEYFYDSSADGWLTPLDALLIINALNAAGQGESESDALPQPQATFAVAGSSSEAHDEALLDSLSFFTAETRRARGNSLHPPRRRG